jgi:hypothetical protein
MTHLLRIYRRAASEFSSLHSVKLLAVRLYWDFSLFRPGRENYTTL